MSFAAHEEKIKNILAGDNRFIIPRNQRRYVWDEKQWRELIGDIIYIKNRKDNNNQDDINHFLGTFVLQENDNYMEIIDGQQRITTLLLSLAAIAAVFNELNNEEEFGKTRQSYIGNIGLKSQYARMKNDNISNIEIILHSMSEFRENILRKELIDRNIIEKSTEGNRRVLNCFYYFYDYFKDEFDSIEELVKVRDVILNMKVIHITSEDELDCYDIFEILNARGVELEESELLKNFIFKYAQPQYSLDIAKIKWAEIEKNMEECSGNMEQFLSHFVTYRFYKPDKEEGIFRVIKSNIDKADVYVLLDEILAASEWYIWFYHPDRSKTVDIRKSLEFYKLVNHRQFRPLFMALFDACEKNKISENCLNKVCLYLKNFSFAFTLVMGNNSNTIDTKIHQLSKSLYEEQEKINIETIKNMLVQFYPSYDIFYNSFLNLGFSNKNKLYKNSNNRKRAMYILKEIELYKQNTGELVCNVEECNIEHIMNDSETDDFTSKIGNLLMLAEQINNNMGSDDFDKKIKKLKNSRFESTKDFIKYYGSKESWTHEDIQKRTEAIAKLAYQKVWKLQ